MGSKANFNLYKDKDGNNIQIPNDTFLETTQVLEILRERTANISKPFSTVVTFEEFVSYLLHWKESTTAIW
jgi:hypothetical protein